MTEEDMFLRLPKLVEPEPTHQKMELGEFAATLSKRSLSTSTPCVQRSATRSKVEDDSGYSESFMDSACTNNSTYLELPVVHDHIPPDLPSQVFDGNHPHSIICKAAPVVNMGMYATSLKIPADWNIEEREELTHEKQSSVEQNPSCDSQLPRSCLEDNLLPESDNTGLGSTLNASGLAERFAEILKQISPSQPDRLIGRKMLLEYVDIIGELDIRNLNFPCISRILDYLEPSDLWRMSQVNHQWKNILKSDKSANRRRKQFVDKHKQVLGRCCSVAEKENAAEKRSHRDTRGLTPSGKTPFKSVQALQNWRPPSITPFRPCQKRELYSQAAQSLQNDESLRACHKCGHPSKVDPSQERARCLNSSCSYDFCIKCLADFHGSIPCVPVLHKKTKMDTVCSKKSKKNLRRLGR